MYGHFNLALIPANPTVAAAFTKQAEKIAAHCDGYRLGDRAEPHITLGQFFTDDERLDSIWDVAQTLHPLIFNVRLSAQNIRAGTGNHEGYDWIEWLIARDQKLMLLQAAVYRMMKADGLQPSTLPDTYSPHVTLGRVASGTVARATLDTPKYMPVQFDVKLALGESTPNGEWVKTLKIRP